MEIKRRCISLNVSVAVFLLCGSGLLAPLCIAAPTIGLVSPAGAARGSEIEVVVSGTNFYEVQEIFFEDGIIQEKKIEGGNTGHRPAVKGGYFPVPPIDSHSDLRAEMLSVMGEMGLKIEKHLSKIA